jgi:hypothetical protein
MVARAGQPNRSFADRGRRQDRVIAGGDPIEGGATLPGEVIGVAQPLRSDAGAIFDLGLEIVVKQVPGATVFGEERARVSASDGFVRIDQPLSPASVSPARPDAARIRAAGRPPGPQRLAQRRDGRSRSAICPPAVGEAGVGNLNSSATAARSAIERAYQPVVSKVSEAGCAFSADQPQVGFSAKCRRTGWPDQRPAGLRAESERNLESAISHRPARRAARRTAVVVRIAVGSPGLRRRIRPSGLAQDCRRRRAHRDAGGVLAGSVTAVTANCAASADRRYRSCP